MLRRSERKAYPLVRTTPLKYSVSIPSINLFAIYVRELERASQQRRTKTAFAYYHTPTSQKWKSHPSKRESTDPRDSHPLLGTKPPTQETMVLPRAQHAISIA
jgi:hypothetical protein